MGFVFAFRISPYQFIQILIQKQPPRRRVLFGAAFCFGEKFGSNKLHRFIFYPFYNQSVK